MPTCYTHKKMGILVYKELPKDTRKLIQKYLPYYLIGLHGPDILFFNPGIGENSVAAYGRKLHHESFEEFYRNACMVLQNSEDDRQLVYFYGYLCHLFSDNRIHAVLPELDRKIGVTHAKMETELDRCLMKEDDLNPVNYPVMAHLAISPEMAHFIAPFYLGVSEEQVLKSLLCMKASFTFSRSSKHFYRKAVSDIMAFAGYEEKIPNMVMCADESKICLAAMPELKQLLAKAVIEATDAIENITKFIYSADKMPYYIAFRLDGQNQT